MSRRRALTIAGSDSGGGAGIQADLKTFTVHGVFGMSAITALTAQNTRAVFGVHEAPGGFVAKQIEVVAEDIGVDAAKTGMLASASLVKEVAGAIQAFDITPLVVDPVFVAKGGDRLLAQDAVGAVVTDLFPLATVVTPNLPEAEGLLGRRVTTVDEMEDAARALVDLGAGAALVKGGHLEGSATDVFYDGRDVHLLEAPRVESGDTHGTGCVLSSAITARLALGEELVDAVVAAKEFVTGAIRNGLRLGEGHGPADPLWVL